MDELKFTYEQAFSGVGPSSETREKILNLSIQRRKRSGHYVRRLSGTLAAAIIIAALLGCGVVATVYGDSIQSWFSYYWQAVTHQPMSEGQAAVIDHLTQEIGLSQTVDGVTVTVDSATVGESSFYLLLRAEGVKFNRRYGYSFDSFGLELSSEYRGISSYGYNYLGLDGDGAVLILFQSEYAGGEASLTDASALEVDLTLSGLRSFGNRGKQLIAQGPWPFSFTLDRSQPPERVELPDTTVYMRKWDSEQTLPLFLTHLSVSNTGIGFQYTSPEDFDAGELRPTAVLKNGAEVSDGGGLGNALDGHGTFLYSYTWFVPVDLDEVACIRIGSTEIFLP